MILIRCLRFVFLLVTRVASWLRLSQSNEAWKTAEILILRHQLVLLQRRQPRRPNMNWADRALLATLLGVIPKALPRAAEARPEALPRFSLPGRSTTHTLPAEYLLRHRHVHDQVPTLRTASYGCKMVC